MRTVGYLIIFACYATVVILLFVITKMEEKDNERIWGKDDSTTAESKSK